MSIAIQWTEPAQPCDTCRYDHVKAVLPFGEFSIEWKSWKKHDAYCVHFNGDYVDSGVDLDAAKAIAAKFYGDKLAQHAEQHQGEPVALPERLSAPGNGVWHPLVPRHLVWNACLDEIAKLGPLYTHADPNVRWKAVADEQMQVIAGLREQLAVADPGEVVQLRAELVEWKERCQRNNDEAISWMAKHDALRAQLAALRELKLPHYLKLSDEMRAAGDHAEQRALEDQCYSVPVLKAVFFEAAIQRWLDDQEEALETSACEHDWVDGRNEIIKSGEFCRKCLAVRAGNETSEPSATKSKPRAHDVMMFQRAPTPPTINGHKLNCKAVDDYKPGECSCGAEPSAPVEHVNAVNLGITGLAEPSATVCSPAVLSQQIDELERIPLSWSDQFRGQLLVVLKLMAGQESKP